MWNISKSIEKYFVYRIDESSGEIETKPIDVLFCFLFRLGWQTRFLFGWMEKMTKPAHNIGLCVITVLVINVSTLSIIISFSRNYSLLPSPTHNVCHICTGMLENGCKHVGKGVSNSLDTHPTHAKSLKQSLFTWNGKKFDATSEQCRFPVNSSD